MTKKGITVLSLFDGISCGRVALERAGIKVDKYYAFEIDKDAITITQKNYPDTIQCGDVFDTDFSEFLNKNIDIIIGGSPCTFWSINKKERETTCDGFGYKLFSRYVAAVKMIKPKYFLYENNYKISCNITNQITKELEVVPKIINSALVSAQQRYRQYWSNIDFTHPQDKHIYVKDILETESEENNLMYCSKIRKTDCILHDKLYRIGEIGKGGQGERIYSIYGKSANLTANGGGRGAKTGLYLTDKHTVRKLSPVEAERCQTLPDNYTKGLSATKRLKGIGNGWTVDVISHIFSFLPDEWKIT